jgi:hypothetical protein
MLLVACCSERLVFLLVVNAVRSPSVRLSFALILFAGCAQLLVLLATSIAAVVRTAEHYRTSREQQSDPDEYGFGLNQAGWFVFVACAVGLACLALDRASAGPESPTASGAALESRLAGRGTHGSARDRTCPAARPD